MSVRNSFAYLDDSDDDEPRQQVKTKAKTKAKAKAPAAAPPARNNNRGPRRDGEYNNRRNNRSGGRGEYNRDVGDNARKYRRDDRRTDRRRDAERRDRRREGGGNNRDRRGRNAYEKTHQKRGPKKGGHGGWGTDKDAVAVAEETAAGAAEATPDAPEEAGEDETPADAPSAPAVVELTLEEHEAAEKERRAKFNERWGSKAAYDDAPDLEKEFTGMSVVGKKNRQKQSETWAAKRTTAKAASRSYQKERELKAAIFAEPKHGYGGGGDDRGYGGGGGGRGYGRGGGGRGRGGRGRNNRSVGRDTRDTRDNRGNRRSNVNTQDVNEFPALA